MVQEIDPNSLVSFTSPSTGGLTLTATNTTIQQVSFFSSISLPPASGAFKFTYGSVGSTTSISWNASSSTIQTDLRVLSGLSSLLVTGSIAQGLNIVFTGVSAPATTLTITANTLEDSSSNAIAGAVTATTEGIPSSFANILNPTAKQQPVLIPGRTIVYPMIVGPSAAAPNTSYAVTGANPPVATLTVANSAGSTQLLSTAGGYAPFSYTLTTNASGGTCSLIGLYTPGGSASVNDVVTVTDALGNTSTITIAVIA